MAYDVTKDAKLVDLFHCQKRVKTREQKRRKVKKGAFLVACTVQVYNEWGGFTRPHHSTILSSEGHSPNLHRWCSLGWWCQIAKLLILLQTTEGISQMRWAFSVHGCNEWVSVCEWVSVSEEADSQGHQSSQSAPVNWPNLQTMMPAKLVPDSRIFAQKATLNKLGDELEWLLRSMYVCMYVQGRGMDLQCLRNPSGASPASLERRHCVVCRIPLQDSVH